MHVLNLTGTIRPDISAHYNFFCRDCKYRARRGSLSSGSERENFFDRMRLSRMSRAKWNDKMEAWGFGGRGAFLDIAFGRFPKEDLDARLDPTSMFQFVYDVCAKDQVEDV